MKKILLALPVIASLLLVIGCSTPESRIQRHQSAFDSWPADVREKVRAGRVEVGFTFEMVQVALGEADRMYTRTSARGASDVWVYLDHGPKFSVGVGVGGVSGNTGFGSSVVVGDDAFRENETMRVVFEQGRVVAIETRRK